MDILAVSETACGMEAQTARSPGTAATYSIRFVEYRHCSEYNRVFLEFGAHPTRTTPRFVGPDGKSPVSGINIIF